MFIYLCLQHRQDTSEGEESVARSPGCSVRHQPERVSVCLYQEFPTYQLDIDYLLIYWYSFYIFRPIATMIVLEVNAIHLTIQLDYQMKIMTLQT
jgi:hypothetical protein